MAGQDVGDARATEGRAPEAYDRSARILCKDDCLEPVAVETPPGLPGPTCT